jgi:type IV pilus assembly protein PilC
MSSYSYSAINAAGREMSGELSAADTGAAREMLRQQGLVALRIDQTGVGTEELPRVKKVKPRGLQVFSRQFATLIEAGVNVVAALTILEEQTEDDNMAKVIGLLRRDVEGGALLSEAMARHPKVFSTLYVSMVEAGEAAGILDQVLDRVAMQIEKQTALTRRVKGAMMYPSLVLGFALLVLTGMLLFLVPVFEGVFADLGGELPLPTRIVVGISDFLRSWWFVLFPLIALVIFGFFRYRRTEGGSRRWDRFKLGVPAGIGSVVLKVAIARFSRTLSTLVSAGVDIIGALEIAGDTAGNSVVADATAEVRDAVRRGERIAAPMKANAVFPPMLAHMVSVGEETGELDHMLGKVADFYEDEVDSSVTNITSVIEPVMMIGVGVVVGVIIISMYLPMFKLVTLIE